MKDMATIVHQVVLEVVQQTSAAITSVDDADTLTGGSPQADASGKALGLESLDLAQIVATLEARTALDPFAEQVAITSIRTVGDLVGAYRVARDGTASDDGEDLAESQSRAQARRRAKRRRARP